ncbi:MAG TPA: redoxin domain-containing protein [Solirubrobacterales bacterium]|nr:redoxin domain-containing protein [Solirubrobacterales bacterium]
MARSPRPRSSRATTSWTATRTGRSPAARTPSSALLEAGDRAPSFTLPDQNGGKITLSKLKGQTVVLYFYPRADT